MSGIFAKAAFAAPAAATAGVTGGFGDGDGSDFVATRDREVGAGSASDAGTPGVMDAEVFPLSCTFSCSCCSFSFSPSTDAVLRASLDPASYVIRKELPALTVPWLATPCSPMAYPSWAA